MLNLSMSQREKEWEGERIRKMILEIARMRTERKEAVKYSEETSPPARGKRRARERDPETPICQLPPSSSLPRFSPSASLRRRVNRITLRLPRDTR